MKSHHGWSIEFQENVYMYCHKLRAQKRGRAYDIPCEDTPSGFIGVWPYTLILEESELNDLVNGLLDWANSCGLVCRIYRSRNEYEHSGRMMSASDK